MRIGRERALSARAAGAAHRQNGQAGDEGRIPFRLRAGITGHRTITGERAESLYRALDQVLAHLQPVGSRPSTQVQLAVVSQLAEGGDRIVVRQVFEYAAARGRDVRLEVVLPMEEHQYVETQGFSDKSRAEFERLLAASTFRFEPSAGAVATHEDRANAYAAAGEKLITRCDILIALWDGRAAVGKRGGTAHTLLSAAARGKPCVWIPVEPDRETRDNLEPGAARRFFEDVRSFSGGERDYEADPAVDEWVLRPMLEAFEALDEYNREPRPRRSATRSIGPLARSAAAVLDRTIDRRFERRFRPALQHTIDERVARGMQDWLVAPAARASLLAEHYRRWFKRQSSLVLVSATLAATVLAVGVAVRTPSVVWPALEFAFLALALLAFIVVRASDFHRRWLCYRVLAERFRSARYLAPTGVDFREQTRLRDVGVGGISEAWLMRAFEEVWDREAHREPAGEAGFERLKHLLADDWIDGQIRYHARVQARQERMKRRLTAAAFVAFGLTLLSAAVEALLVALGGSESAADIAKGLTILLPVLGASLGAALTLNQPAALAERSTKMQTDLRGVQAQIRVATDIHGLVEGAVSAANLIAPEAASWFGALWFLDLEHP